jgi:hypothetical protein
LEIQSRVGGGKYGKSAYPVEILREEKAVVLGSFAPGLLDSPFFIPCSSILMGKRRYYKRGD